MAKAIKTLAIMLLLCGAGQCQMYNKKCEEKAVNNGAGYVSHNTDCDKFIQCRYNSVDVLEGHIRQCAFSTYWSDEYLTCIPANNTSCSTDKCQQKPTGAEYKGEGNCRGYWQCVDGKSVAMCCPRGQKYVEDRGCVDNVNRECTDTCFNDVDMPEPEVEPEVPPCDKEPVPGNPNQYKIKMAGLFDFPMPCPPGTYFKHDICECTHFDHVKQKRKECKRELYLTFDEDVKDKSGNKNHVFNQNVTIEEGVAKFNGINSRLIIPRFNNIEHTDTLVLKVKYWSNHKKSGYTHAIVSNSDCMNIPSIMLSEDNINTYFGVGSTQQIFTYTYLPHPNTDTTTAMSEKKLEYKFTDGRLTGSDGYGETETPAPGYLRNVHCALHVGYAEYLSPFEGEIDELEIFLCDPDDYV